jgi:AraC-like DNA-binding protein
VSWVARSGSAGPAAGQPADARSAAWHVPERQWTTAGAPQWEQFPLWQEAVDQAFVPVTVRRAAPGPFLSEVGVRRLGPVEVADIAAPPQSVSRTPSQVERDPGDVYFLNLPLGGGASARQDGRTARLSAGDFAVVDSARPFELDFRASFRQLSLKLPREVLQSRLPAPWEATGVRVPGGDGIGAVASAAIRAAAASAGSLDRQGARALGEQLADLVALALGGVRRRPSSASGAHLMRAALEEAERSLGDPGLTPAAVAERIGISTRYLHRLFSERGPSFGRWILARRLDLAHRDLTDLTRAHWTVGQIAQDRGFADPSYFARAFKARYGVTPSELRSRLHDPR